MKRILLPTLLIMLLITTACSLTPVAPSAGQALASDEANTELAPQSDPGMGRGNGMGGGMRMGGMMGMGNDMMARHMAPIPSEYAGLTSPIAADEESLARGEETYTLLCASCHGDGGMGDGPAGAALDPVPAPIAHTSQMMGDDYLFWRISEGGAMEPFNSLMPTWKASLDEQARWDVINYVRALGRGEVMPRQGMGGAAFDPQAEAAMQAEMLARGVEQGIISQDEADTFDQIHALMDDYRGTQMQQGFTGSMADRRDIMLAELVNDGKITQSQADAFADIHDRLIEAGLMQ